MSNSVLSEIISGDCLSLGAVAKSMPSHRGGMARLNISTVWRWVVSGTKVSGGRVVKLEAARVGSRWLTSKAAIQRYMEALTNAAADEPIERTDGERLAEIEAADRRLAAVGA